MDLGFDVSVFRWISFKFVLEILDINIYAEGLEKTKSNT